MLAIRRTTVTLVAGNLEKDGVIICGRGYMQIVSRDALQRRCCECYGVRRATLRDCMPLINRRLSRARNFPSLQKQRFASVAMMAGIAKLPLIELPAEPRGPLLAIVLSGDGGWRDLDKTIAETLQSDGVSVVGWDCLSYFWSRKSP